MAEEKIHTEKKTYVEDIERTLYDIKDADHSVYKTQSGLTEEIIRDISKRKHDPQWMLDFRLKSLEVYNSLALRPGARTFRRLNMDDIVTYVQPDAKMTGNWQEVRRTSRTRSTARHPGGRAEAEPRRCRRAVRLGSRLPQHPGRPSSSRVSSTRIWRRPSASMRTSSRSTS